MLLQEKALAGLALGSSAYFEAQRAMVRNKALLRRCYDAWYELLLADEASVPADRPGLLVELGSGGSTLADRNPAIITTDVVAGVASQVVDARELPFADASVRALFLTHALHHVPQVERFFAEASRVLVDGGVVSMVEVAHTPLARAFFRHLHPEPYDDSTSSWDFTQHHSMADANQALSWLVFVRDRARFEAAFGALGVEQIDFLPWFSYLASGGVTRRAVLPDALGGVAAAIDHHTRRLWPGLALHWHIRVRRAPRAATP